MITKKKAIPKTVFISSTYIDLKEERKRVWECLEKFNVNVKGMEQFGARKTAPLDTCLAEVEQSDIYVGIIGMRYGSEDVSSGKSMSQLEYEKALKLNKEILIYLIDEENSNVKPSLIQFEKIDKLNNFKAILRDKHTIDTFASSTDLVEKLQRKFSELLTPKILEKADKDEFSDTKKILNLFFLVPAAYSGREIKLLINFTGNLYPASQSICKSFNFEFGKTVVCQIEVIKPDLDSANFRHIFLEYSQFEKFRKLGKGEHEVFAKVLFKADKEKKLTANFKDKIVRVWNERYLELDPADNYDPREDDDYYDELREGDGMIALALKDFVSPPKKE